MAKTVDEQLRAIRENLVQLQAHGLVTSFAVHALISTHPNPSEAAKVFERFAKFADAKMTLKEPERFQKHFDRQYGVYLTAFRADSD